MRKEVRDERKLIWRYIRWRTPTNEDQAHINRMFHITLDTQHSIASILIDNIQVPLGILKLPQAFWSLLKRVRMF